LQPFTVALAAGTRIGSYEIATLIGAGGMGEVYRARDQQLGRDVAVKVLPESLASDAERLARFEREARTLAALNHPNIAQIYGLEQSDGMTALVMELVEGPTLADRLIGGPIPRDEALTIARQIAEALEASHEQGIVHRDLKPANIKLRPDGVVKILDFGLAKLTDSAVVNIAGATLSPTITSPVMTGVGVILGTAAYMAPEQAAGKLFDKRADIWSFGVVLWEMLTGTRLFAGAASDSVAHVLADVLRAPIDFERIPAGSLRHLLERCLDRDVKMRLRDIGEARVALTRAGHDASPSSTLNERERGTSRLLWQGVAAALALSTAVVVWAPWRTTPEKPLVRLEVDLGADVSLLVNPTQPSVALSPDGTRLVYSNLPAALGNEGARGRVDVATIVRGRRLLTRRLDQTKAVELSDAEGAANFFFSPDSQWIAFSRGNQLFKISVDGGKAVPLAEFPGGISDGDWAADGTIVIGGATGVWRVPPGGKPIQVTKTDDGARGHLGPRFLPGEKAVVYASVSGEVAATLSAIEAVSLADGKRKELIRGGVSPQYLPTGHLIYMSNGALQAIAFDPDKVEARGTAVPILDDVRFNAAIGLGHVSVSSSGTLVYRRGGPEGGAIVTDARPRATLDWVDASGKHTALLSDPQGFSRPRFSPDGSQIAVLISDRDGRDYWVYDTRRGTRNRITFGDHAVSTVAWTPDSRHIFFGSGQGGKSGTIGIFVTTSDGAGQPQRVLEHKAGVNFVTAYSAAAKSVVFNSLDGDIFALQVAEENGQWKSVGTPEPIFPTQFRERMATLSPDGRWIAYTTDESGQLEVVVRPFKSPASGQARKWTISTAGGARPIWSLNGRELLYQERDRIMAVSYSVDGDTFKAGLPRVRVAKFSANEEDWDMAPDGRIAAVTQVSAPQQAAPPPNEHTVIFLENFFDEVRRRVN
jgi:serine/threonine-protein kinase